MASKWVVVVFLTINVFKLCTGACTSNQLLEITKTCLQDQIQTPDRHNTTAMSMYCNDTLFEAFVSVERCFVNAKVTCAESTVQIDGMIIAVRAIRDNNKMICEDNFPDGTGTTTKPVNKPKKKKKSKRKRKKGKSSKKQKKKRKNTKG